jgi:hypothetical protein
VVAVGLVVALGLVIVTIATLMVRQHQAASRDVPLLSGPLGVLIPVCAGLLAIYLLWTPLVQRGLPNTEEVLGFSIFPTPTPTPAPPDPCPAVAPTPEFVSYWVKNHRRTQMWSGPAGRPGILSFGVTSDQFCVFEVVRRQDNPRLYVMNPYDKNYFWIEADSVGPIPEAPEHRPEKKPSGQNCEDAIYDG